MVDFQVIENRLRDANRGPRDRPSLTILYDPEIGRGAA